MKRFGKTHLEALERLEDIKSKSVLSVYVALAAHADRSGRCWPAQDAIADAALVSVRTVQRSLPVLAECGLVEIDKRSSESGKTEVTHYRLPLLDRDDNADAPCQIRGDNPDRLGGDNADRLGTTPVVVQTDQEHTNLEQTTSCEPEEEPFRLKGKSKSKTPAMTLDELIQKWNAIDGVVHCRKPTDSRKRAFAARSKEPGWASEIDTALDRVSKSSFLRGQTDRGNWKADIDWILKPDSMTRILEGKYDDAPKHSRRNGGPVQRTPGRVYDD
jgi:hypothetical protein